MTNDEYYSIEREYEVKHLLDLSQVVKEQLEARGGGHMYISDALPLAIQLIQARQLKRIANYLEPDA